MTKKESIYGKLAGFIFYAAFVLELALVIYDKSAFTDFGYSYFFRITFLMFLLKAPTVRADRKTVAMFIFMLLVGLMSYRLSGRNDLLRFVVFAWDCLDEDAEKLMRTAFYVTLAGCLTLIILSVTGIFGEAALETIYRNGDDFWTGENLSDPVAPEIRYCLGMGHPNALHVMFFSLLSMGIWLFYDKLDVFRLILMFAGNIGVFVLTGSKLGFIAVVFLILITAVFVIAKPSGKVPEISSCAVWLACIGFSILVASIPGVAINRFWWTLNRFTTGRIQYGNSQGNISQWGLFSTGANDIFFDMGWIRLFYWYGLIPGIIITLLGMVIIKRAVERKELRTLAVLLAVAVISVFDAHYISRFIGRNPILVLAPGLFISRPSKDGDNK